MAATPLYFGDSNRRLYGVYHHPEIRAPRAPACLLFNPFGEEAIRSFRIFKQLAERLARNGSPVLRFDYYGSGDSEGVCGELDFNGMVRDAATAQEELEALSGVRRFNWIGLGLGGAVALRAANAMPSKLFRLFLWDAVLSGDAYLAALRAAHVAALSQALDAPAARIDRETPAAPEDMTEAMGFHLSEVLRKQLSDFSFADKKRIAQQCHIIATTGCVDAAAHDDVIASVAFEIHHYDGETEAWNSAEAMNAYTIPAGLLDYVVNNAIPSL